MKQIIAIIRTQAINKTKETLIEAGISGFTVRKVIGRGRGNVDFRVLHGAEVGQEEAIARLGDGPILVPKRMITVVVPDAMVDSTVRAIIEANHTGNAGDGKIFVLPVKEVVRVRTGECGYEALDPIVATNAAPKAARETASV
jgi:nitrogen regulatory protein PII 2